MDGYAGRFLRIDLTGRRIETQILDPGTLERFVGGSGLGAWLLLERYGWSGGALDPDNPLLILTGPLSGTGFPGTSRFTICAHSPLTGI